MKTLLAAVAVLAAGSAFATPTLPQGHDTTPIVLARADDATGEMRRGRGRDDGVNHKRHGADDPAGDDRGRRGRGRDDGVNHKRHGADDPAGDDRGGRGRGRDDGVNHKRHGADDPAGDDRGRRGRGRDDPSPHA